MRSRLSLVALALLLATGCGGDSSEPAGPALNPLDGVSLAVTETAAFDAVVVTGLTTPAAAARATGYVAVLNSDGADELSIELEFDGADWQFLAPPLPASPGLGGTYRVRIQQGENASPEHVLQVDGLPAAPGAFADMVAKLREHLELTAALAGTTLSELKSTSSTEVADALLPLKLAQAYLDSDLDENDLTDLASNANGFLSAEEVDLLDRMFGYCDFEQYLQLQIDELQLLLPRGPQKFDEAGRRACIDVTPEITSAPALAQAMIRSRVAEIGADPDSEAGRILSSGGTMLTGAGFVPGFGRVAAVGGIALSAASSSMALIAGVNPTYFSKLEAEVDNTSFNEDSTEQAKWKNVWVTANSNGWYADQFIATSVISLVGGYLSDYEVAKIADNDLLRDIVALELGIAADMLLDDRGVIEFCPGEWRVNVSSPLYCTAAALERRFDVDIEAQTATPAEVGTDQLEVTPQAAQFGGRSISLFFPMEIKPIEVVCTPDPVVVTQPGQDVNITTTIANADLTTLRWLPEQGSWNDGLAGTDTNDGMTRTLKTPTSPDEYPFFVRVESLSRRGLREGGDPARIGFTKVELNAPRIEISPGYACISPGETQQFERSVTGIENYTVRWGVVSGYGSISQSGLYQSLSGGTTSSEIAAWLEEFPAVGDTVSIDAAACNCNLEIKITGDSNWQQSSSQAAYTVSFFDQYVYTFFFDIGSSDFPLISASLPGSETDPAPAPGVTGSWKASFVYATAGESWVSIWDDPDIPLPGVRMNVTEADETHMVGTFTGNAFQLNEDGEISSIVGVDVKFRAGRWDGGQWPCQ